MVLRFDSTGAVKPMIEHSSVRTFNQDPPGPGLQNLACVDAPTQAGSYVGRVLELSLIHI